MSKRLPKVRKPKGSSQSPAREKFSVLTLIYRIIIVTSLASAVLAVIIAALVLAFPPQSTSLSGIPSSQVLGAQTTDETSDESLFHKVARMIFSPLGKFSQWVISLADEDTEIANPITTRDINQIFELDEKGNVIVKKQLIMLEQPIAEKTPSSWGEIKGKPSLISTINQVEGDAGNIKLAEGSNIEITRNEDENTITIAGTGSVQVTGGSGSVATVNLSAGTGISISGTSPNYSISNTNLGSSQNIFKRVAVSGQSTVVADSNNDTLTFAAGAGITLATSAANDRVTITAGGAGFDADTLDTLDSLQFLRSDTSDSFTSGTLTIGAGTTLSVAGSFSCVNCVGDGAVVDALTVSATGSVAAAAVTGSLSDAQVSNTLTIDASGSVAAASVAGTLTDAQVSNTLTVAATGSINAGAIDSGTLGAAGVTLAFGSFGSITGTLGDANVANTLTLDATSSISATALNSGTLGNAGVTLALGSFGSTTGSLADANVDDTITLTNITQITNRAITDTTGTLTVARGGTGLTTIAQGGILYSSALDTLSRIAPTGANQVLRSTGANALEIATLVAADIPSLDASKIATGSLALTRSGTGADLSATGGANQFVKQSGVGAAFTVGTIADADVPDTITASNYLPLAGGTMTGGIDMANNAISNIGAAGTDFSGTGGLTLADALTVSSGGASVTGGLNLNSGGITNAGAVAGASTINATGTITGGSLTDGTLTISSGALTGGTTAIFGTSVTSPSFTGSGAVGLTSATDTDLTIDAQGAGNIVFTGFTSCTALETNGLAQLVCGSDATGSQTPWTSDIDADGYDLIDLSNLLFRETEGAPLGTDVGLFRDNSGDLNLNVLTGKTFNVQVNGGDEYNFGSSSLNVNNNTLLNIGAAGTDFSGTGGLTLADDLTVNANASIIKTGLTNDEEILYVDGDSSGNPTWGDVSGIRVEFQPYLTGGTTHSIGTISALVAWINDITLATGNIAAVAGIQVLGATDNIILAGSTITDLYGILIEDPFLNDADLTVTNPYGLYIADWGADGATFTNGPHAIYQAGADDLNVFMGETAFGRAQTGNDSLYGVVIQGALCVDDGTANCPAGPTSGAIYVENSVGAGNVSAFDIAEYYPASNPVDKGDVVVATGGNKVGKSSQEYDPAVIGVVSTDPAVVIDETSITFGKTAGDKFNPLKPYVALAGRAPVKVSTKNGDISPGDPLTSSSTPGVAMKATKSGPIVGKALEAYGGSGVGKIMVFVSVGWYVAPLDAGSSISDLSNLTSLSVENLTSNTLNTQILFVGNTKISMAQNGALKIEGNVEITGEVFAKKLNVGEEAAGSAVLEAGETKVVVETQAVTGKSQVFITPNTLTEKNLTVTKKEAEKGFTVEISSPDTKDIEFDWFIIN